MFFLLLFSLIYSQSTTANDCYDTLIALMKISNGKIQSFSKNGNKAPLEDIKMSFWREDEAFSYVYFKARSPDKDSYSKAELSYEKQSDSAIKIDEINIAPSIQGYGVQTLMMKYLVSKEPNIKRIRTVFAGDNSENFFRELAHLLGHKIENESFTGSDFYHCCKDDYLALSEAESSRLKNLSLKKTAAFSSRKSIGFFNKCKGEPLVDLKFEYGLDPNIIPLVTVCR